MTTNTIPPTLGITQDAIQQRAMRELAGLRTRLFWALENPKSINRAAVQELLTKMWRVYETAEISARISGWITPWAQHLNNEIPRGEKPSSLPPSITPAVRQMTIWDTLDGALRWLNTQITQFPPKLAGMITRSQVSAAAYGLEVDNAMMDKLNQELMTSIRLGEGRDDWRKRLKDIMDTRAGFDETISRTATHKAYLEGQRDVLNEPVIRDLFPYRQYFATLDNRVRPEHKAMDRKVYHRDSTLARQAAALLNDWNCRCSETSLTEEDALQIGVSPGGQPIGAPSLTAYAEESVAA